MRPILTAVVVALLMATVPAAQKAPRIELVLIPAGSFVMGSDADVDERPPHTVTISKAYYIGKYEVTQAQWNAVMPRNPSQFVGADLPVERVKWGDAVAFCKRMSALTGKTYRLPTEAEWEYACRAGTTGARFFGDNDAETTRYAWFDDNSKKETHPVGGLAPNPWGLHDVYGNAWEWCADWYGQSAYTKDSATDPTGPAGGEYRVMRGGSYGTVLSGCRSSNRFFATSDIQLFASGLRVVVESNGSENPAAPQKP